jgi:hypothetical protein
VTAEIKDFVPWNALDAAGLAQQITAHIKYAREQGYTVGLAAVLIIEDPKETGRVYTPVYSEQQPEVSLWAARTLEHHILKAQGMA